jgi:hypothetical protein
MGWVYPVELVDTNGQIRNVSIPHLKSRNGQEIWSKMKAAVREIDRGMESRTDEDDLRKIDSFITNPQDQSGRGIQPVAGFPGVVQPGHVEQALANIALKIEDRLGVKVYELSQASLREGGG